MTRSGFLALLALAALPACLTGPEVSPDARAAAEQWAQKDQAPAIIEPVAVWYANGNSSSSICGEIEARAGLGGARKTLRYIYDPNAKRPYGQVEMHEGWMATSVATTALLDANRKIFDGMWTEHCADAAPIRRRLATSIGIDLS